MMNERQFSSLMAQFKHAHSSTESPELDQHAMNAIMRTVRAAHIKHCDSCSLQALAERLLPRFSWAMGAAAVVALIAGFYFHNAAIPTPIDTLYQTQVTVAMFGQ